MNSIQTDLNEVLTDVRDVTGIDSDTVLAATRKRDVVDARQLAYAALRSRDHSYETIGEAMNRDHGSVSSGCRAIGGYATYEKKTMWRIEQMRRKGYTL